MNALFEAAVEASLVMALALASLAGLRGRSAAVRHTVLAVAFACIAGAPLLGPLVPSWSAPLFDTPRPPVGAALTTPNSQVANSQGAVALEVGSWALGVEASPRVQRTIVPSVIAGIWAAGFATGALTLLVGLGRLTWIAARAVPILEGRWARAAEEMSGAFGLRRPVRLLTSAYPTLLVTWGVWQPKVILPLAAHEWSDERIQVVLAHELAHVRRRDWIVQLGVQVLRCVYWFNPLVWIAASRLRQESEQACDDQVLNLGTDPSRYATHLLELARAFSHERRAWSPAPAIVRPSSLERRVRAMLSPRVNRDPVTRPVSLAVSVALLAATIAVAGFTASAQSFSTVSGTVVDQQGALLPGVAVVLTNARSGQKYEVRTTQTGRYQLVGIPSGEFTLSVRQPGFRPVEERMTVSRDVQRDLSLRIGTLQETVTVTATSGDRSAAGQQYNVDAIRERFKETVASCNASATGGNIRPPRKITHVSPLYPEGLRAAAIGGAVKLDATIDGEGRVRDVAPVPNQTIDPGLVSAAIDAVNQWEFTGTLLNCVPVDVVMTVTVNFNPNQ